VPDLRRSPLATYGPAQSLGYPDTFVHQLRAVHQLTTTRLASQYAAMQDEARLGQAQGCHISFVSKREKATPGCDAYHDPETQLRGVVSHVVP
jgi:hypothetical protein